ncbi:MAG: multicopper oxidase domain-containing protein [bacterium]
MTHRSTFALVLFLPLLVPLVTAPRAPATVVLGDVCRPERSTGPACAAHDATTIAANDNRASAGVMHDGVLTLQLETGTGIWYPEGEHGVGVETAAWREVGKPLESPGPVIRVASGTLVKASIHNTIAKPLTVYGLAAQRGMHDSIVVAPGATRAVEFRAGAPGTYYYAGQTVNGPLQARINEDSQLNGAIIVDPVGAKPSSDRVFLISWWFLPDSLSPSGLRQGTMTINGLSWPHTEKLDLVQHDSVHWRVINMTPIDHPMHLHGFYYRIDAKGDGARDTLLAPAERRMAVTEIVDPGQTMAMSWVPSRAGNWIFHCHFAGHLSQHVAMDTHEGIAAPAHEAMHMTDAPHQMYGLVLGIRVAPRGRQAQAPVNPRAIRMLVRERPDIYGTHPGYSFILGGTPAEARPDSLIVPGPVLVLVRGKPVAVTIVNNTLDRAAVHWHGIELQSYPDGVPGWSGSGKEILPSVAPGDSIVVRFTPPRAGTFMYHSHFNEFQQITSGLYGPIIVLEPGQTYNPDTDRVLMFSDEGPTTNVVTGPFPATMLNGSAHHAPLEFKAGVRYRVRVLSITGDAPIEVDLAEQGKTVDWRAMARDGMTLPASQAVMTHAHMVIDPGQIYDFQFTPHSAGDLTLTYGFPKAAAPPGYAKTTVAVRVR